MLNAVHSLQVSALNPVTVSEVLPGCGAPDNFVFFFISSNHFVVVLGYIKRRVFRRAQYAQGKQGGKNLEIEY